MHRVSVWLHTSRSDRKIIDLRSEDFNIFSHGYGACEEELSGWLAVTRCVESDSTRARRFALRHFVDDYELGDVSISFDQCPTPLCARLPLYL